MGEWEIQETSVISAVNRASATPVAGGVSLGTKLKFEPKLHNLDRIGTDSDLPIDDPPLIPVTEHIDGFRVVPHLSANDGG